MPVFISTVNGWRFDFNTLLTALYGYAAFAVKIGYDHNVSY